MLHALSFALLGMTSPLAPDTSLNIDTSSASTPPNIIFVFPDQFRKSAIGYYGKEPVKTPNLDRFARQSYEMDCISNYPVCSPFRAMLMTGKYSFTNNVFGNCYSYTAPLGCELASDSVCWSDILKTNGYNLGYVGKWHLDAPQQPYVNTYNNKGEIAWNEWCPPERRHGFDYWYAYGTFDQHTRPMYWSTNAKRDEFKYVNEYGPKHEVDKAIEFMINQNGDLRDSSKPFALVISMNPPHTGYEYVPQKYKDMYKDLDVDSLAKSIPSIPPKGTFGGNFFRHNVRNYYAQITAVDEEFGRLMDFLDSSPYGKNSIVIFTSDHGDNMGMYNEIGKNQPYESSIAIPCFIRTPYPHPHSTQTTRPLMSVPDFAPTILGFAGLSQAIPSDWDGYNFQQLIAGLPTLLKDMPDGQLYIKMPDEYQPNQSLKYPANHGRRGWRTHTHTYYIDRDVNGKDKEFLYDRIEDPYMLKNIASESPELCKAYKAKTYEALTKYGDKNWKQNTP